MAKHFEEVRCSARVIFKIFTEEKELTPEQVKDEVLRMETYINERLGVLNIPDRRLKIGTRIHIGEVGLK